MFATRRSSRGNGNADPEVRASLHNPLSPPWPIERGHPLDGYTPTPSETSDSPEGVRTVPLRLFVALRQLTCGRNTD